MSNRSYTIVGTGAVGGYYGACLQKVGYEVHFLLHRDYDRVRQRGLIVESPRGDFTLPEVKAYNDAANIPPTDVVIIALKATNNNLLAEILPLVVRDESIVLLLQNGLGGEAQIDRLIGHNNSILGGLCFVCSHKIAPGHIRHLDYGAITLGEYSLNYEAAGITHNIQQVASDFQTAGIEIILSPDLLQSRWEKLVWNIPYNGLSVVLDATTREMMGNPQMRSLIVDLMREVALGARSCERHISDDFVAKMLDYTDKMTPYTTSMKLDYDRDLPLEIDAIFGYPLKMSAAKGVKLPRIEMLYKQLQFLNRHHK